MMNIGGQSGPLKMSSSSTFVVFLLAWVAVLSAAFIVFDQVSKDPAAYCQVQTEWFLWINRSFSAWPEFWGNVTELGNALVIFPLFSYLIICYPQAWAGLFGAVPLATIFSSAGKNIAAVPRPAALLPHEQFNIIGETLMANNSFPSGHSIVSFAVITVVVAAHLSAAPKSKQWLWVVVGIVIAAVLSISRVAVGAHWPLDTVAGGILGIISGVSGVALARYYRGWWGWMETRSGHWVLCGLMLFWGVALKVDAMAEGGGTQAIINVSSLSAIGVGLVLLYRLFFSTLHPKLKN